MNGYESRPPGPQNALDIFSNEWTSALPLPEGAGLVAGQALLFADPRVVWALRTLGGVANARILELGPLEGGHSFMLERAGAREIVAIEGNRSAYLRCLVIKEILGLTRVRYLCGDFNPYLRDAQEPFDAVFAAGVLYHQLEPMQMLYDIARLAPALYLWTHYYDADSPSLAGKIGPLREERFDGMPYLRGEFRYMEALAWSGFCGGSAPQAHWLPRADILAALRTFGFNDISIAFEDLEHINGPCFALVARR